jgi:hypothetical protein
MAEDGGGYNRISEAAFKKMIDMRAQSFSMAADYGKWLISSLFLMHGSAIAGLIFKGGAGAPPYLTAIVWFIAGIVLALGSGFSAWWNFSLAAHQYDTWANPNMLTDVKHWPGPARVRGVQATLYIAVACGVFSVLSLIAGAFHVLSLWR